MKIVFFGSTDIAIPVLRALYENYEVVAVVTTPDQPMGRKKLPVATPIATVAAELNISTFKFASLKSAETKTELQNLGADLFIVGSYGKIIPESILNIPKHGSINIHPSLLPKYRGPSPIPAALLNGDTQTGTSIILMDAEMDHGPILAQSVLPIDVHDTFSSLAIKLWELSAKMIVDLIPDFASGKLIPIAQDEALATYTKLITKEDGKINWGNTAEAIYNQFRAYESWPGIWTSWQDQIIKILDCLPSPTKTDEIKPPGCILDNGLVVCGNNTLLQLKNIQLAGKNPVDLKSFINGHRDFGGSSFD